MLITLEIITWVVFCDDGVEENRICNMWQLIDLVFKNIFTRHLGSIKLYDEFLPI